MAKAKFVHTLLWRLIQISFGIYIRWFFRIKVNWLSPMPKRGFLLVGNHSNKTDPFICGTFSWNPINYMANIEGVFGFRRLISSSLGCFNIRKGRADKKAFVNAMKLLKENYTVGVFPEGDRSWTGRTQEFSSMTASMAKRMKTPIVMVRFTGSYMSRPRWNDGAGRRGKLFLDFDTITEDQINQMTKDDIFEKMKSFLANDDFTDPRLKDVDFVGQDLAVGLENLLWKCPHCEAEDKLWSRGDEFHCKSCESSWTLDAQYRILSKQEKSEIESDFKHILDWYDWQKTTIAKTIESSLDESSEEKTAKAPIIIDSNTELVLEDENAELEEERWVSQGEGQLELWNDTLKWISSSDPSKNIEYSVSDILNIIDNFNLFAIVNHKSGRFRVVLNDTCCLKWTNFLDAVLERDTAI